MSYLIRSSKVISALLLAFVITGCATSQRMSSEDKARIKSTQVSQSVEKGQVFLLAPGGAAVGMMFGAVGGAVSGGMVVDAQTAFVNYLNQNNISIEKLVQQEFENALRASGKLSIATSADAGIPTIKLSVPQYGFGVTHLLSSNVVPVLQMKADMVDDKGQTVWSASDRMLPSIASPMTAIAWAQIQNDPKEIEAQLRAAAKYLSNKLVQSL
ncbi:MAG TPA: hypothetical protein VFW93_14370 [Aquabacterium sp.]|uniref:hypothetical protein n=1 Tax=Aquabacterium sp. TaxID=1872578 RepID=UPI002E325FED|nr:hypothetical protein [Aquabacterium sp.]HEX5357395.1 hypothetical protein [Aquabacterium sp.]